MLIDDKITKFTNLSPIGLTESELTNYLKLFVVVYLWLKLIRVLKRLLAC